MRVHRLKTLGVGTSAATSFDSILICSDLWSSFISLGDMKHKKRADESLPKATQRTVTAPFIFYTDHNLILVLQRPWRNLFFD